MHRLVVFDWRSPQAKLATRRRRALLTDASPRGIAEGFWF